MVVALIVMMYQALVGPVEVALVELLVLVHQELPTQGVVAVAVEITVRLGSQEAQAVLE